MKLTTTRRAFLKSIAQTGAGAVMLAHASAARTYAANEKLNLAHIGCGGRGRELILTFSNAENIVALCDVNEQKATEMYRKFPDVKKFQDYRTMFDEMGKQIDAVAIAVPDHSHGVVAAAAIRAGKHVYTEKPLTRTVGESRALRGLAKQFKVATSMGNQGTAAGPFRRAMELIQNGTIGPIKEVVVWNDQGGQGWKAAPEGEKKIPPYLNWDLWLGPARARPFHERWMAWQFWRDFGTAQIGNWASHTANLAFRAMKVDSLWYADPATKPILRVEAQVDAINRLGFSRWEQIKWHIPARGELPPITFNWLNGGGATEHRKRLEDLMGRELDWGDKGEKKWKDWAGCMIVGAEGKIYATGHNATFTMLPADKFKDVKQDQPEKLERSQGHERDWLIACRGGKPAWANFDFAGPLNEFLQLGNAATQFKDPLEFDPLECKVVNNPEADQALRFEPRPGWTL